MAKEKLFKHSRYYLNPIDRRHVDENKYIRNINKIVKSLNAKKIPYDYEVIEDINDDFTESELNFTI